MERVLVIGSYSLIGMHISKTLRARGLEVLELSTDEAMSSSRWRSRKGWSTIYYCGIQEAVELRPGDAIGALSIASRSIWAVIQLAIRCRATFVFVSGAEIYGRPDPANTPQGEKYRGSLNPCGETGWFGQAMRFGEAMSASAAREFALSVRIVRAFYAYGDMAASNSVHLLPRIVDCLLRGEISACGDSLEVVSFCHVDDTVDGILRAANSDCSDPVNIGSPKLVSRKALVREICRLIGCEIPEAASAVLWESPWQLLPDTRLATQALGWRQRIPLKEGINGLVASIRVH